MHPALLFLAATATATSLAVATPVRVAPWTLAEPSPEPGPKQFVMDLQAPDHAGKHDAVTLKSLGKVAPDHVGVAYEVFTTHGLRGKRVRISLLARARAAGTWAGIFARPVAEGAEPASMEGMRATSVEQPIWALHMVVVDVPVDAVALVLGLAVRGGGFLGAEPPTFAVVGPEVPLSRSVLGDDQPQALDFEAPATGASEP